MDNNPINFIRQTLIIMVDNLPRKTTCSKSGHALTPNICDAPMHVKWNATAWCLLVTCMHIYQHFFFSTQKLHVIQT